MIKKSVRNVWIIVLTVLDIYAFLVKKATMPLLIKQQMIIASSVIHLVFSVLRRMNV